MIGLSNSKPYPKDVILEDLRIVGQRIADHLWAIVEVLDSVVAGTQCFGFIVTKGSVDYTVLMEYKEQKEGYFAIANNSWTVLHGVTALSGLTDLGQVMKYIKKISKVDDN